MCDEPFSLVFIRECYINWFTKFLLAVKQRPRGRFALSSSPGCGKTFAITFIFKMAITEPFLRDYSILYQFQTAFYHFRSDTIVQVDRGEAENITLLPETFYILDGPDAEPVHSICLTLFISSPRNIFKDWHYHSKITPSYFPVWSLEELRQCRALCYPTIDEATVDTRYLQYGGIARYVFWEDGKPPSLEAIITDSNARRSIHSVGEPSRLFPSSHMLLHITVDEDMHFRHVVLASRYVGVLLFSKYFQETLDNLTSMLGAGSALAVHLFECYAHFLFQNGRDEPLNCRSLEGLHHSYTLYLTDTRPDPLLTRGWQVVQASA
jgi:hypothetical protein